MSLPNNLKDLQKLKAQLKELLSTQVVIMEEDEVFAGEDLSQLTVKALKERCEEKSFSKCGTKAELKGFIVEETRRVVLPSWKIEEWNIYDKILNDEETKHMGNIPYLDLLFLSAEAVVSGSDPGAVSGLSPVWE